MTHKYTNYLKALTPRRPGRRADILDQMRFQHHTVLHCTSSVEWTSMGMEIKPDGWCVPTEHHVSPHMNERPEGVGVDLLVIHNISLPMGEYGNPHVHDLFMGVLDCSLHPSFKDLEGLRVSSHFVITRDGRCHQYVSTESRAWHAGRSVFQSREGCNDFSVGVELEGSDYEPFEAVQYATLVELTHALMSRYPGITSERIVGHSDIAPERKTDPGPYFDWSMFRELVVYGN